MGIFDWLKTAANWIEDKVHKVVNILKGDPLKHPEDNTKNLWS